MMVTKRTMPTHEWAAKYDNIKVSYDQFANQTIATIAAISAERGVDHIAMYRDSVNVDKFKLFLQELRDKYFFDDICLYMDNLSVHRSKVTKERMNELGFGYIFGPSYSPDLNPIESVFSIAKSYIKKERLRAIASGEEVDIWKIIRESFDRINSLKVFNCI